MIRLTISDDFDFTSDSYRALYQNARCTAFQSPEWLSAFYRNLIGAKEEVFIILGHNEATNRLEMVLPLVLNRSTTEGLITYSYADVTDYVCPILSESLIDRIADDTNGLSEQFSQLIHPYGRCQIKPVREQDLDLWSKLIGCEAKPMEFGHHQVEPELPFDEWSRQLFGKRRTAQIKRKIQKLSNSGALELKVLDTNETSEDLLWAQQTRAGRFEGDPIQKSPVLNFYTELSQNGSSPELARCYRLSLDKKPLAVCFGIIDEDCFRYLVLAADYTNYGSYSPGTLALYLAMEEWTQSGGKVFDFTIGDESYKGNFHCTRRSMYQYEF